LDQPISLETVLSFLSTTSPFDNLDAAERADVIRIMEILRLQEGEAVVREGEAGDAWYVVFEGEARVSKMLASGPLTIARLKPSDCFGEMAVLDGEPRSATVEAAGPLTVFRFRRARFDKLLEQGSLGAYKLVAVMARTLSRRQRQLTQRLTELLDGSAQPAARPRIQELVGEYQTSE
jgi:CRP-like cAMP-binding protein